MTKLRLYVRVNFVVVVFLLSFRKFYGTQKGLVLLNHDVEMSILAYVGRLFLLLILCGVREVFLVVETNGTKLNKLE